MTDAKPQELDPALVEKFRKIVYPTEIFDPYAPGIWRRDEARVRYALLSLGIPAAALNALAKGEAVVVDATWAREMEKRGLGSVLYTRT